MNNYCLNPIKGVQTQEAWSQPWMTISYDPNLFITEIINFQTDLLWHFSPDELIHKSFNNLVITKNEANRKQFVKFIGKLQKAQQEKRNVHFQYASTQKNGNVISIMGHAVYGPEGKICCHLIPIDTKDAEEMQQGSQKEFAQEHLHEKELIQSKLKTDLAFRAADIVLWEYNTQSLSFTCYNEALNGYDQTQKLTLQDYLNAFHPEDHDKAKIYIDLMAQGKDESFEFSVRIKYEGDSEWQHTTIFGSPFEKDSNGKVILYVGIRRNNTGMQKQRDLLHNILDNVPIPIQIIDVENNHKFIFWNEESNKLFGKALSKNASFILNQEQAAKVCQINQQVYDTGETYIGEEEVITSDGKIYETISRKSIIYDGNKRLLLAVRWDVSSQEELRRKSKILSISVDAIKAFTWYYDTRDEVLVFGDGFEKTGGNRKALSSMLKFAQQIHPEDREGYIAFISNFLQTEEGDFAIEYKIDLANNGNYEWWECRGVMETIHKNDTTYKYMYGMDINIEAHKQIELDLRKNKAELANLNKQNELILNNTNSGLAYVTKDYIVQWENISCCGNNLISNMYKKGTFCFHSTHGRTTPCESCLMQKAFKTKQKEKGEFDLENGQFVEVTVIPVMKDNEETDGAVIRIDDITDRKQMIKDLQKAKAQAEQSDKLKSAFLANMSHEIRTPLNAIVGFSELLMYANSPTEKEEFKRIINTNNELLLKLINDILDLSKIESGFVELKPDKFDLAKVFNEIAISMQYRVKNPKIQLIQKNPYENCIIELDRNRLTQIVTNYVSNAIKYTAEGCIEMGYEYIDSSIRLYVKDSGIGISEEKRHKVFQRFEKLDEFAQGTGLGLSICKAIAEAFGGSVGFESTAGKGSTFWALIPCTAEITQLS